MQSVERSGVVKMLAAAAGLSLLKGFVLPPTWQKYQNHLVDFVRTCGPSSNLESATP